MTSASPARWITPMGGDPDADLAVLMFPHAGGGPSAFRGWAAACPGASVHAVALPGREMRFVEPLVESMAEMADEVVARIGLTARRVVFLGHSMGGTLAFETALAIEASGWDRLEAVCVAGALPPHLAEERQEYWSRLPGDALVEKLSGLDGAVVWQHPELRDTLLPIARADLRALEGYRAVDGQRVRARLLVAGGEKDPDTSREDLTEWDRYAAGDWELQMYPGDHFFLHDHKDDIIRRLTGAASRGM
jgi:pyochelin biosynthesis protein PchC